MQPAPYTTPPMPTFTVEAVADQEHEGRIWGYTVRDENGLPYLACTTGGTGSCWNLAIEEDDSIHVCDLDNFIAALTVLRDSAAHAAHKARWAA